MDKDTKELGIFNLKNLLVFALSLIVYYFLSVGTAWLLVWIKVIDSPEKVTTYFNIVMFLLEIFMIIGFSLFIALGIRRFKNFSNKEEEKNFEKMFLVLSLVVGLLAYFLFDSLDIISFGLTLVPAWFVIFDRINKYSIANQNNK